MYRRSQNRGAEFVLYALVIVSVVWIATAQPVSSRRTTDAESNEWEKDIPPSSFVKIDSLSGEGNYYTVESDRTGGSFIHANYVPPREPTKLGYKIPDAFTDATRITWKWRIFAPPQGADERQKGKNDSGAAIYLLFKKGFQTLIIKYVYSTTLPPGTVVRKDPFYPFQRMFVVTVVTWNEKSRGVWQDVSVDIKTDFKRLYETATCPPLLGIGIMSDGDGTTSEVVADYGQFTLSGVRN